MTSEVYEDIEDIKRRIIRDKTHLISGYVREQNDVWGKRPVINSSTFEEIINNSPTSVPDKLGKILLNLEKISRYPGDVIPVKVDYDYPVGYCSIGEEFEYFLKHLCDSGLLKNITGTSHFRNADPYSITVKGWDEIERLKRVSRTSRQVFIAMNFDREYDECYENGIKAALEETGYVPYRIDREEHTDKIDDKILSEIKRSKFIIAEFTGQKHGVYFEAGYAFGLDMPVIWTCKEDDIERLHFDTRQYNHIVWGNVEELKEKLINRIRVVIGDNRT